VIWGVAILGVVFNSIDLKKFKVFSMICYLAMGWLVIFTVKILIEVLGVGGFTLLVSGGIVYTIGAILYAKGKQHKWFHSIFHLCCFLGSLLHILCVLIYVL
jgi:hemolysin III